MQNLDGCVDLQFVFLTFVDYGRSFSDVVQGVGHILENLSSDQISAPSSFKYRIALEKQVMLSKPTFV